MGERRYGISAQDEADRIGDIFVRYYDRLSKQDHRMLGDARDVLLRLAEEDAAEAKGVLF